MRKISVLLIMFVLLITGVYADITISGDARVRPRLDIKDNDIYGNKSGDIYYLYRARLLLKADIGDGYYFNTRLGHNGIAYWVGKFGTGVTSSASSIPSAGRGSVDFMELYFGHNGERFAWSAGLIPIAHNPLVDIHYYPKAPLDIPWVIFSSSAAHGFNFNYKLAGNKLNMNVLVDNNSGNTVTDEYFEAKTDTSYTYVHDLVADSIRIDTTFTSTASTASETRDQYTLDLSYPMSIAGMTLSPQLLLTIADEGKPAPMTYGAGLTLPKVAGFKISAYAGMTNQTVSDSIAGTEAYSGWISRFKLVGKVGPGTLTAWYDAATTTPDVEGALTSNFGYTWISYTYTLYKSDKGSVSFAPTYRLLTHKIEDSKNYSRAKIELTTQITFK